MDDTGTATAPPPPLPPPPPPMGSSAPPPRRAGELTRDRPGGRVAGVCSGVARWLDIDPLVLRVVVTALVFVGGAGLLLYGLGWLLLPEHPGADSEAQRLLRRHARAIVLVPIGAVVLGIAGVGGYFGGDEHGVLAIAVVAAIGFVVAVRQGRVRGPEWLGGAGTAATAGPPAAAAWGTGSAAPGPADDFGRSAGVAYSSAATTATAAPTTYLTTATTTTPPAATPTTATPPAADAHPVDGTVGAVPPAAPWGQYAAQPTPPPRPRSALGRTTVSLAALAAGATAGLQAATGHRIQAPDVIAAALACVGAGLVVGTVLGRSRWLIAVGALLAVACLVSVPVDDQVRYGVGEQAYAPRSTAALRPTYRHGVGQLEVDLTRLPAGTSATTAVRLGVGQLLVTVPRGTAVHFVGHVRLGDLTLPGFGTDDDSGQRDRVVDIAPAAGSVPAGTVAPTLTVHARLDLGSLEVRRAAS